MAARPSFSHESRMVKMPLPSSVLLKDYLLDDLSSCSSNGFRSYPRRQCCTKVRYLIEIDLNKHVKLPHTNKNVRKNKLKPKLKLKASLVNVFKSFKFSGNGSGSGSKKTKFLPRNLSRKLSMHGFWKSSNQEKKEIKKLNSFDESIKCKENILPPVASITTEKSSSNIISNSNSISNNSPTSSDSCFTITSNSSTTCGYSKTNVAQNEMKESEPFRVEKTNVANEENVVAVTRTATTISSTDNAKDKFQGAQRNEFSPISVIEFPSDNDNDDEDEVTSPFQRNSFYAKGCKQRLKSKVQRTRSLAQLNPVRLEDRITLSESGTHGLMLESSLQAQREFVVEKRALALLQLLKATMSSHDLSESPMTERVLLGFFAEQFIEGNVSNYIILQEAKDWINGQTKEIFELQNNKVALIKEMEKGVKWLNYSEETREVVSELEFEVFTSLVEEILFEFYV